MSASPISSLTQRVSLTPKPRSPEAEADAWSLASGALVGAARGKMIAAPVLRRVFSQHKLNASRSFSDFFGFSARI